ncbi:hypothetical protein DSM104329_01630 [Capillimicrobium parvum]|uniref:Uncharacterized protein n=1 Tax=Capillimicrobium parvum TaxID=2884022 RepID=A0A9E6XVJ9_9ACTN|nr:hypothetical protein DSM104329_01630 [Capillimicrobium parvum]
MSWGIDMQLGDIRDMLRLPMFDVGLEAGQNFAATTSLVNVIAGASVWFYDASEDGLSNRGDRSRRYRETLEGYWPWDTEAVDSEIGIKVLYDHVRNPLAHAFGMPGLDEGTLISIAKSPLTEAQIAEIDHAETRPSWIGPTMMPAPSGAPDRAYFVNVPALYWGVRRTLYAVLTDEQQLPAADALAQSLMRSLVHPNASWRASGSAPAGG